MTTPVIPGLNRAQRRQAMRAQGWRGSKAKRQFPDRSAHRGQTADDLTAQREAAEKAQAEHERRQGARQRGLIIPPTPEEMDGLKASGKLDHDPRLLLPGD